MDNRNYSSPVVSRDGRSEATSPGVWRDINKWRCASCKVEYGSSRPCSYAFHWKDEDGSVIEKAKLCGYCHRNHENWARTAQRSKSVAQNTGNFDKYKNWVKQFSKPGKN